MPRMEDWTDEQWADFWSAVDNSKAAGKHSSPTSAEEREATEAYLKNPEAETQRIRNDIANRREESTPDVRYDESTGSYYDRFGRECDKDGERY